MALHDPEAPERIWMHAEVAEASGFGDPAFRAPGETEYVTAASRDAAVQEARARGIHEGLLNAARLIR